MTLSFGPTNVTSNVALIEGSSQQGKALLASVACKEPKIHIEMVTSKMKAKTGPDYDNL